MVAVGLRAIFLNDMTDPSDLLRLTYVRWFQRTPAVVVSYRRGAGGRVRQFTRPGRENLWALTVQDVTPAQKAWLEARMGRLVCVRDDRGGRLFGSYGQLVVVESTWSVDAEQVSFTFTGVSYSEAV